MRTLAWITGADVWTCSTYHTRHRQARRRGKGSAQARCCSLQIMVVTIWIIPSFATYRGSTERVYPAQVPIENANGLTAIGTPGILIAEALINLLTVTCRTGLYLADLDKIYKLVLVYYMRMGHRRHLLSRKNGLRMENFISKRVSSEI